MPGMFYSLREAAGKLHMTDQQVQQLVKEGKLREFRDGANVLFKVDEVEALAVRAAPPHIEEPAHKPEPKVDTDFDLSLLDEGPSEEPTSNQAKKPADTDELFLPSDTAEDVSIPKDLEGEDTVAASEGVNILDESGEPSLAPEDMLAETKAGSGSGEGASLEEIEEDVNLDTFGSGSGLLDLSLQADDTSLGGILDEIYTSEGEQETTEGSALDLAGEPEAGIIAGEAEIPSAESGVEVPMTMMGPVAFEAAPDAVSNALGISLFLPLVTIIFTAVIAAAAIHGVTPDLLKMLQSLGSPAGIHIVWYITGGMAVLMLLIVGGAALTSGGTKTAKPGKEKAPKPKKEKPPKPAKQKKGKPGAK